MNTAKAKDLYDKIPKFSGQKEDVQLEEVVRQIENFADLVQWMDNKDGENGAICYLFRDCLLYTSPSPRDGLLSRMPSSA